ncbi:MAG: ferredoxin, partial [Paludibacteraceae bacterium]|nr:ferredoxin [Paludibacteraceae bacterium]
MVFCFSGTGNSRWVAEALSDRFRLSLINIGDGCGETPFRLNDEERLFFVFPIHAWSMPKLVRQFIRQVRIENYHGQPVDTIVT